MITTLKQTIAITDVEDVIVTPAILDEDSGDYVREVRILVAGPGETTPEIFVLRISADTRPKLDITAPVQEF